MEENQNSCRIQQKKLDLVTSVKKIWKKRKKSFFYLYIFWSIMRKKYFLTAKVICNFPQFIVITLQANWNVKELPLQLQVL